MKDDKYTISVSRPLSGSECSLIEWLLNNGISEATKYKTQLQNAHVVDNVKYFSHN